MGGVFIQSFQRRLHNTHGRTAAANNHLGNWGIFRTNIILLLTGTYSSECLFLFPLSSVHRTIHIIWTKLSRNRKCKEVSYQLCHCIIEKVAKAIIVTSSPMLLLLLRLCGFVFLNLLHSRNCQVCSSNWVCGSMCTTMDLPSSSVRYVTSEWSGRSYYCFLETTTKWNSPQNVYFECIYLLPKILK